MRIGIVGGGQLGMMLTEAAIKLGHVVYAIDPNPNAPVKHVGGNLLNYRFDDLESIKQLDEMSDVICYEFENIDLSVLRPFLPKIPQGLIALEYSNDRMKEKEFARSLGIPTPRYQYVQSEKDVDDFFYPSLLKTTRFGYDGKGQVLLKSSEDLHKVNIQQPMILEELVNFDQEVSVIVTRDMFKHIAFYPLIKNVHVNGILDHSIPWWDAPQSLKDKAYAYASKVVETLNYIGTLAIEFFLCGEELWFNEMAPRPHNSGHFSIEGTTISQFENMILAITGEHVKTPLITKPSIMLNILGQHEGYIQHMGQKRYVYHHDYDKGEYRVNRKMGHITYLGENEEDLMNWITFMKGETYAD